MRTDDGGDGDGGGIKGSPRRSFVKGDEGCIGTSGKLLFVQQVEKNMQHLFGTILYMLEYWADPVVHLLLLKSLFPKVAFKSRHTSVYLNSDVFQIALSKQIIGQFLNGLGEQNFLRK